MKWVCDICGYVHDEEEPPMSCPTCGAPKSKFSEWDGEDDFYDDDDDDEFDDDDDDDVGDDNEK